MQELYIRWGGLMMDNFLQSALLVVCIMIVYRVILKNGYVGERYLAHSLLPAWTFMHDYWLDVTIISGTAMETHNYTTVIEDLPT